MKHFNKSELWEYCIGMTWVWDYCKTGTAAANAPGVREWLHRTSEHTASLRACASVAAEIARQQREPMGAPVGDGFGEMRMAIA